MPASGKGFWKRVQKWAFSLSLWRRWKVVICVGSLRHSHAPVSLLFTASDRFEECCYYWLCFVPFADPERHFPAKSETQPELFGALPAPACLLSGVFRGETLVPTCALVFCIISSSLGTWFCNNVSLFCNSALRQVVVFSLLTFKFQNQEDSASSNPFALPNSVTPPLPTFARVTTAYGSYQDANIPFPRTSGARFCGAGWSSFGSDSRFRESNFSLFLFSENSNKLLS